MSEGEASEACYQIGLLIIGLAKLLRVAMDIVFCSSCKTAPGVISFFSFSVVGTIGGVHTVQLSVLENAGNKFLPQCETEWTPTVAGCIYICLHIVS